MLQEEDNYLTVQQLEQDLLITTGNPAIAKQQAQQFAIYYRGEVIDAVRYQKGLISDKDLVLSRHVRWENNKAHSKKLHKNMLAANKGPRPANTSAHHIVAWGDMRAARARLRLAAFGIDIDDAVNGVYLPSYISHTPMNSMPDALAHSKMHTNNYYLNVEYLLDQTIAKGLGRNGIIETLDDIAADLQEGEFELQTRIL